MKTSGGPPPPRPKNQPEKRRQPEDVCQQGQQRRPVERVVVEKAKIRAVQRMEPDTDETEVGQRQRHNAVLDPLLEQRRQRNRTVVLIRAGHGIGSRFQRPPPLRFRQYIRRCVPGSASDRTISKRAAQACSKTAAFSEACRASRPRVRRRNIASWGSMNSITSN